MKWSWKVARIAGIDVFIHSTFFILIAWIGFSYWITERSIVAVVNGVIFILLLFLIVLMHEFGHALAAKRFGIATRDITLLPIGGLSRLERMPKEPKRELWVALSGPLVNLVLAVIFFVWLYFTGGLNGLTNTTVTEGTLLQRVAFANMILLLFNIIPAFPMDGGRVLRAFLATRMEYTQATHTAASIGQGFALIFGLIGLLFNPFLIFIAFFVWIGASQESSSVQVKEALSGIPIKRAMLTQFKTLESTQRLSDAADAILTGYQQEFPVMKGEEMVGILTRSALVKGLATDGPTANIASAMDKSFVTADGNEMLEIVSERLQTCGCHTVPIFENNELIGLVTMENIGEFLMIESAIKRSAGKFAS